MLSFIKKILGISSQPTLNRELLEKGTIIDVRSPSEFKSGHAANSINIPIEHINSTTERIRKMPPPIITCCKSGMRSAMAVKLLKNAGIDARNAGTWQKVERLARK